MANTSKIAGVMIALTVAAVLLNPIAGVVNDNSGDQDVVNESVTAQHDEYVDLDGYDVETDSETVYFQNGTAGTWEEATKGTDYEMNYTAGSVQALSSGEIEDGEELKVSYTYAATDGTTTTVVSMVPLFVALLILGVIASRVQDGL